MRSTASGPRAGGLPALRHASYRQIAQAARRRGHAPPDEPLHFADEGADLWFREFRSSAAWALLGHDAYRCDEHAVDFGPEPTVEQPADCDVDENLRFRYPVLERSGETAARHVVVFLHGLNERSYSKYIPWAYQMWRTTGASVALFPLAFHINRVAPRWALDIPAQLQRRQALGRNDQAHAFNATISERLDARPERFFWGGLQSYLDVVDLARAVRQGRHPGVAPDARIDLVGYSAGGYLALVLLLADTEQLFSSTRAVLFESCAPFGQVSLCSRFILDLDAELALLRLYVRDRDARANPRLRHFLDEHEEGRWFKALCGDEALRPLLEARLRELAPRLRGIANLNDRIIPAGAMMNLLQGLHRDTGVRVDTLTLGVHEHPFNCASYGERDRRFVAEFLDEERYGDEFAAFVHTIAEHFRI